jgi:hypothetical protein
MGQTRASLSLPLSGVRGWFEWSCQRASPNHALEPTPYSLRFATASGRGSPPALGDKEWIPCQKHLISITMFASPSRVKIERTSGQLQTTYQNVASAFSTTNTKRQPSGVRICIHTSITSSTVVFWLMVGPSCRHTRLLLGKQVGKDIFCLLPELEALVGIENQRLHECLRLLATRFPDGFEGRVAFCR